MKKSNKQFYNSRSILFLFFLIAFSSIVIGFFIYFYSDSNIETRLFNQNIQGKNNESELKISDYLDPINAYAIIIGISDYPGSINDLSYCDDDARDVYSLLINDFNFKRENIIYL